MGRAILTLLCLWSCIVISTPLTHQQVQRATEYIRTTFNPLEKRQYAYVAVFTKTECDSLSSNNNLKILQNENAVEIADALNHDERIYEGKQMVLATYRVIKGEHNIHSEFRLLFPPAGRNISPVQQLLNMNKDNAACVIFFTLNSPCVGVCTKPNHEQNIIGKLSVFKDFNNDKAFVYSNLYKTDLKRKGAIWSGLTEVNEKIDVYRCFPKQCYKCFEDKQNKEHCMN